MAWEDLVLAAGGFIISFGIIPTIRGPVKPPLITTLTFVGVLTASFVAFVSLGLWLTAAGIGAQAILWAVIMAQTLMIRRNAQALTHPTVATPDLGFEEYRPTD